MNTISLKLPKALLDRVEEEARNRRRSKSAVIRDCLDESLRSARGPKQPTCADLARHLAGSVRGPRDLAANKDRYLRAAILKDYARARKRSR
jgi:predicted transcriptional regulator